MDDPRNRDEIGEKELLVVSFGTSYRDSRRLTIGAIENALDEAFEDFSVRRAFTSKMIINRVLKTENLRIDSVQEALERAVNNGVSTLVVQPTHIMKGIEYDELKDFIMRYADSFEKVSLGEPLLTSDDDFRAVAEAMTDDADTCDDGNAAIVFMGHGTAADSNSVYEMMQEVLFGMGKANCFVGTVEASPSLEDVIARVREGSYKKVVLRPMMVVAGNHANKDMAGDSEDSWKSQFKAAGYDVEVILDGLGQVPAIRQLYVEHAKAAVTALDQ